MSLRDANRYGGAVLLVLAGCAGHWLLGDWLQSVPFLLFFPIVAAVSWYAGLGPALLSTILSAIAGSLLILTLAPPADTIAPVLSFLTGGAAILALGEVARRRSVETDASVEALRRSESRLRAVTDALPVLISYVDAAHRYRFNNRTYRLWFGHATEEIQGKHMREVLGDAAYERILPQIVRALAGETVHFETTLNYKDAGVRDVSITYVPHRSGERVEGFFVLVEDMSDRKRADRLRAHLAAIVESSDDAIVSETLEGRVTSWNPGAERLYGYTAEEMLGQLIDVIVPTHRRKESAEILGRVASGERIQQIETERVTKNGRIVPVSVTFSPVFDASGRIVGVSKSARDISDRQQAERALQDSQERLELALSAGRSGVWDLDLATNRAVVSPSYRDLYGHAPDAFVTYEKWLASVHPADRDRVRAYGEEFFRSGSEWRLEYRILHPTRGERWLSAVGRLERDANGRALRFFGVNFDITERKRAELELQDADRRKDEFLATLGHELRNPLAPITNAAQILLRRLASEPDLLRLADMVARQARHMNRLVDDLLDLSRISRGQVQLRRERLNAIDAIRAAVETCRPQIDAAGHQLEVSLPEQALAVEGDLARLAQVFSNLLNNACKYTPPGGRIEVAAAATAGEVVIAVRDTGVGIPPDMLSSVFEMFSQVQTSIEHARGGLGVGLTVAKQLIELHGGRIEARSEGLNRGSEFIVHLPLATTSAENLSALAPEEAPAPGESRRVLVADDNRDAAESLAMLLEQSGHVVRCVFDGAQAVDAAASFRPEIVLLDIGMPGLNGYDAAVHIRKLPGCAEARLIAVTGWGQEKDRERGRQAGFDYYITKPIEPGVLKQLMSRDCQLAADFAELA